VFSFNGNLILLIPFLFNSLSCLSISSLEPLKGSINYFNIFVLFSTSKFKNCSNISFSGYPSTNLSFSSSPYFSRICITWIRYSTYFLSTAANLNEGISTPFSFLWLSILRFSDDVTNSFISLQIVSISPQTFSKNDAF
jgi:hypothetical protein